jgi:hypothetical protein
MTESEWLACDNLFFLWWYLRYRSNKRKSRLYTVACCRQIWHLFVESACRRAIEVSERFADRLASREELIRAKRDAEAARSDWEAKSSVPPGISLEAVELAFAAAVRTAFNRPDPNDVAQLVQEANKTASDLRERQLLLFHDLAGPRLFRPVPVNRSWLTWNDGVVPKMAQVIYDDRAFERLPLLADALEEAGCDNQEILDHCRSAGEHVRGCWVVDLLLGKS